MAKFCPKCGVENDVNAQVCAFCGNTFPVPVGNAPDTGAQAQTYLQGVLDLRNYTIIGFISLIVGIAINLATLRVFSYDYLVGPLGSALGGLSLDTSNLNAVLAYSELALAASSVLTIIGLYMLFRGFGVLRTLSSEFSVGRTGATLEMFGTVILLLGIIAMLAILLPVLNLGYSNAGTTMASSELGAMLGIVALVIIAAVLVLVGVIMVLIGIYRVGTHFDSGLVQAGAVLTLLLGIIGTILLFIGFTKIINKLRNTAFETGISV